MLQTLFWSIFGEKKNWDEVLGKSDLRIPMPPIKPPRKKRKYTDEQHECEQCAAKRKIGEQNENTAAPSVGY